MNFIKCIYSITVILELIKRLWKLKSIILAFEKQKTTIALL